MLDYRGIEALYTVQELQSFEKAAKKLHITQSAISQRISSLEKHYGEPLLIRALPYHLTAVGNQLVGHFKRICLLEEDLESQLKTAIDTHHVSIALNRDSLDTWFLDLIEEKEAFSDIIFDIIADDQELTLNYLKKGLVSACLSTSKKEILGGHVHFLGNMEYVLVASPEFVKRHFSKETPQQCLRNAPALKFDQKDNLHERYLKKYFELEGDELSYQVIPSVRGFKKFALLGYGYGLIPKMDITDELKKKQLMQIYPTKTWSIPLYWHYWSIQSKPYQKFNANLIRYATEKLTILDN